MLTPCRHSAAGTFLVLVFLSYMAVTTGAASSCNDVIFITSPGCTKCAAAEKVLNEEVLACSVINFTVYEYFTDEGREVIREHNAKDVPSIVIGNTVIGYEDYDGDEQLLRQMIKEALLLESQVSLDNYTAAEDSEVFQESSESQETVSLSMATVFLAGLLAGFNPCLLGILVFLATSVMSSSGRRRDLIYMICSFSFGIFAVYYLFGAGLLHTLHSETAVDNLRVILTAVLVVLGLVHIEDARRLRGGDKSLFKEGWTNTYMEYVLRRGKLTSYFLLGALFSLVKAPCVGAVYIAILGLISSKGYSAGAAYLVLYNLGIVLPVLLLGGVIALGMSPEQVDRFRKDHRAAMRFVTGAVLLLLAPFIYYQII
jgi:cytochrome c-type biogenesis protein